MTSFSEIIHIRYSTVNFNKFAILVDKGISNKKFLIGSDASIIFSNTIIFCSSDNDIILFYLYKCDLLMLNSSYFSSFNNISEKKIIYCEFCTNFTAINSKFIGFQTELLSVLQLIETHFSNFIANVFFSNIGNQGGAIYLINSPSYFIENTFLNNFAFYGGSIFYEASAISQSNWTLSNNTFINCSAFYGGGSYYWIYSRPNKEESNHFINNTALSGPNFMSEPAFIIFVNEKEYEKIKNSYIPSQFFNLSFQLKDFYNQSINYIEGENKAYISFESVPKVNNHSSKIFSLEGNTLTIFNESYINFTNIRVNVEEFAFINLTILVPLLTKKNPGIIGDSFINSSQIFPNFLTLKATECPIGYIFDNQRSLCQMCEINKFSLNKNDTSCNYCLENAVCNGNGSFINLNPGYWRSNYFSTSVYKCFNQFSCLGGDLCHQDYQGRLCDNCILNETLQYFKLKSGKCQNCNNVALSFFAFLALLLFLLIYTTYIIKVNLREISNINQKINVTSVFFKILADYFQIYSCFLNILGDLKSAIISDLMEYAPNMVNLQGLLYPLDCFIFRLGGIKTSVVFKRVIMITLFSGLSPFLFSFIWIIYSKLRQKTFSFSNAKKKVVISLLILCYLYQPPLINIYFQAQDCYEIDKDFYMKLDLNEKCWENDHLFYTSRFILPCLCIWMFILPGILFLIMLKHVKKRKRLSILQKTDFSYVGDVEVKFFKEGYKESVFYWEFINLIKKYLFIIFSIFSLEKFHWNVIILSWLSFLFLFLQNYKKPYLLDIFNKLAMISHLIIYLNSIILLILVLFIENFQTQEILIFFTVSLNCLFLVIWSWSLWKVKKVDFLEKIKSLTKFTKSRHSKNGKPNYFLNKIRVLYRGKKINVK